MGAVNPVTELIRRKLLDFAPFGTYQDRYELYDLFDKVPTLAATPGFREETIDGEYNAASVDKRIFIAPAACTVTRIDLTPDTAGTDGGAVTLMAEKVPSAVDIGAGSDLLSATFDLKGTVDTIQNGSLSATPADLILAAGDAIALDFTGTLTTAVGAVSITVQYGVSGIAGVNGASENWILSGTNAADANATLHADGGINLVTAGADNDQIIISPRAGSQLATIDWEPEHASRCEWVLELPAITTVLVQAGFSLTPVLNLTTDADQAKFQFSTEGVASVLNWTAATSIGGVDTEIDSDRSTDALKTIRLAVEINTNRIARYYVNGLLKHTSTELTAGVNLKPFCGIQALGVAALNVRIRAFRASRELTAA